MIKTILIPPDQLSKSGRVPLQTISDETVVVAHSSLPPFGRESRAGSSQKGAALFPEEKTRYMMAHRGGGVKRKMPVSSLGLRKC
jgi:hypothetical protein